MSPRALHVILASTLALAVASGPLAAASYASPGSGSGSGSGSGTWNGGHGPGWSQGTTTPPKSPHHDGPKGPKGPKGDDDATDPDATDPDEPLEGSYEGQLISTSSDTSSKPTAAPVTPFEMPFACGEVWTGTTRAGHSPSVRAVDWNRTDDFGDPVVAAADGVVITAVTGKNRPSYGQFVVIDHGNSETSLYGHLDSVTVTVGQTVTAGTQIGTLGDTGNSFGAHLHFEERKSSSVVDAWFHGARYSLGAAQASQNCGKVSIPDVPLAGNVVGDPRADLVVFRRTTPGFYVNRAPKADKVIKFGSSSDQPLLGDWDGDGKASPGVRVHDSRRFALKNHQTITRFTFGGRKDLPVAGDWDGDGLWEVGMRRAKSNVFRLRAADGTVTRVSLGDLDDLPVTGDWDGDGDTDLGVYDSATATYTLRTVDETGMEWLSQVKLGDPGDLPVVGDWDANGFTDLGIWDPISASFSMRYAPYATKNMKGKADFVNIRFGIGR